MAFNEKEVVKTIQDPARVDRRGTQFFAIKAIDANALRVVYEERKDYLLVITFYPVRRYGV